MATAPRPAQFPVFYKDLMLLNSIDHGTWPSLKTDKASRLAHQHAWKDASISNAPPYGSRSTSSIG